MSLLELRAGTRGAVTSGVEPMGGRHAVVVEVGPSARHGSLSLTDGEKLAHAARTALDSRIPLVAHVSSAGALVGDGIQASHGWGLAARAFAQASGAVPILLTVSGPAVSGLALLLGLADQVVMTEQSYAFVTGIHAVREHTGVAVSSESLGGVGVHARHTGVASLVVSDIDEARLAVEELLAYLPDHCDSLPPFWPTDDPPDRPVPEASALIPENPAGSYDVRQVVRAVVDRDSFLELRASWSPNLVTGLATLGGHCLGVVANQPLDRAGTIDIAASQKGARFVSFCDAFGLPLLTFVDTPGFLPGKDLEWRGMIRHGAQLAFAYARASVPRFSVTLRKSYGGAYIVMDSKHIGNDLALAWPSAEIAVMGAKGAVEILHRSASPSERARLQAEYEARMLNPYVAASRGSVDMVIDPGETRQVLTEAISVALAKREPAAPRAHDNTPL